MGRTMIKTTLLLAAAFCLCLSGLALGDGGHEWGDVAKKKGDPSPSESSSNLNNYLYQDEQINVPGDKDGLVKVLRANQKILLNDYRVRVFPIQNASTIEIRNAFREAAAAEGGRCEVIRDKVKGEKFLFCLAPDFQMPYIEAALKELDQEWLKDNVDGSVDVYVKGKFRDISTPADIALVPASGKSGTHDDNLGLIDGPANAAYFNGEPYRAKSFAKTIAKVDQPIPQVLLEAVVYEVDVSNMKQIGVDYMAWKNGPGRNLFEFVYWGGAYEQDAEDVTSILDPFVPRRLAVGPNAEFDGRVRGFYRSANYMLTAAYLDFLEGSGRARVVTRGKVLVKHGKTGTLEATDETLHFNVSPVASQFGIVPDEDADDQDEGDDGDTNIPIHERRVTKEDSVSVGFRMEVVPRIGRETMQLELEMELNNIVGLTPSGPPQLRTHDLSTTVLCRDGEEICIAGLHRTEDVKETQKMPVLGSIPVLGWLFGHEKTVKRETEFVVVLRPRIRVGAEVDLLLANTEDDKIRKQVERKLALQLPKTEYGFDQWLLGEDR